MFVRNTFASLLLLVLCGCASSVDFVSKPVERTPLNIDMPAPLTLEDVDWKLQKIGNDYYFSLTKEDFERQTLNTDRMTGLLSVQRKIIEQYKTYYETPKSP